MQSSARELFQGKDTWIGLNLAQSCPNLELATFDWVMTGKECVCKINIGQQGGKTEEHLWCVGATWRVAECL